jgi:sortase A
VSGNSSDLSWGEIVGSDPRSVHDAQRRLHHQRTLNRLTVLCAFIMIVGIGIIVTPFALQHRSQVKLSRASAKASSEVAKWPDFRTAHALTAARSYNRCIAQSGQAVLGEAKDPFAAAGVAPVPAADATGAVAGTGVGVGTGGAADGTGGTADDSAVSTLEAADETYRSLLTADGIDGGIMASVKIPQIDVDLPVYHGTSTGVLAAGAGHLYGTSLPVGGPDSHAVITGHRGLVDAAMFTRLDEMEIGDPFYVEVLGTTLGYRVDRIDVIDPEDVNALRVRPGEDRVTLMTCTPYGVNTRRLLVSGTRAAIPASVPHPEDAERDWRERAAFVGGVFLVVLIPAAATLHRNNLQPHMRHAGKFLE